MLALVGSGAAHLKIRRDARVHPHAPLLIPTKKAGPVEQGCEREDGQACANDADYFGISEFVGEF